MWTSSNPGARDAVAAEGILQYRFLLQDVGLCDEELLLSR